MEITPKNDVQLLTGTKIQSTSSVTNDMYTMKRRPVDYKRGGESGEGSGALSPPQSPVLETGASSSTPVPTVPKSARKAGESLVMLDDFSELDLGWLSCRVVLEHVVPFLDWRSLVHLMYTSRPLYRLLTSDTLWCALLVKVFNMKPLLALHDVHGEYYHFFLTMVVTTAALHGHYTFAVQPPPPPPPPPQAPTSILSRFSGARHGGGDDITQIIPIVHTEIICSSDFTESNKTGNGPVALATFGASGAAPTTAELSSDPELPGVGCDIAAVSLLLSSAGLGHMSHRIGRAQFLCTYKNDEMEVLQGSCRFSATRRCFALCCNAFGGDARGPVFTVAIATVTKLWAKEKHEHFAAHRCGLRLIMTPVLWEGQTAGSQISERDIIAVSRPPLHPVVVPPLEDDSEPVSETVPEKNVAKNVLKVS